MPFSPAPPSASLLDFMFHWQTQPSFGETVNGDGLFLEKHRTDGRFLLLLVDAMHHGQSAADLVDHLRDQLLLDPAAEGRQPGELLTLLNTWLAPVCIVDEEQKSFLCALALLVEDQGGLVGSAAGSPSPHCRESGTSVIWQVPGEAPLGACWSAGGYGNERRVIAPGDGMLACTDGVTEAGTPQYGQSLLQDFISADSGGRGLVARLFAALQQHVGKGWPSDDTTALWLER